jgi:CHAP domain
VTGDAAVRAVLAEAARYVGEQERPRGSNRSLRIDYWLAEVGLPPAERADPAKGCVVEQPGAAWCAAFVHQAGRQALGAAWPIPRTASVAAMVRWAEAAQVLLDLPHEGDLFVLWNDGLKRYAHVGFVESIARTAEAGPVLRTIEGNTNPGGSREGFGVFRRERRPSAAIRYLRWIAALEGWAG